MVQHSIQHLGTLGGNTALAGPEKPVLTLRGHWVHVTRLVLQGRQENLGQHMSIMSSPGQAVDRLHALTWPPFPVGPGF